MVERVLLVDFENVQKIDLMKLPPDVRVLLVLGSKQSKLPTELVLKASEMGERFRYIPINGQAHNAVDFCVAFYLGEYLTMSPSAECVVLSKDKKGFDPLIKHLATDRGFRVQRVSTQAEAFRGTTSSTLDPYTRVVELLSKEKHRPAKVPGLAGKLKSWLPQASADERQLLMQRLISEGKVAESGGKLRYAL